MAAIICVGGIVCMGNEVFKNFGSGFVISMLSKQKAIIKSFRQISVLF